MLYPYVYLKKKDNKKDMLLQRAIDAIRMNLSQADPAFVLEEMMAVLEEYDRDKISKHKPDR